MTIDELIKQSHKTALAKGWWPTEGVQLRSVAEQVNNFHGEVSEAWEEYRSGRLTLWWSRKKFADELHPWNITRSELHPPYSRLNGSLLLDGWKPEGFWVEIADLCIRIADTIGAYEWAERAERLWYSDVDSNVTLPHMIGKLHRSIDGMVIGFYGDKWNTDAKYVASSIVAYCLHCAEQFGEDLMNLCELKMQYNTTRPERHGGKRA